MSNTLLSSYGEYDAAIDLMLSLAEHHLDIFDPDLSLLKFNRPARHAALKRLLSSPQGQLRIVVQNSQAVLAQQPLLIRLLETYGHHFTLLEANESLRHLSDAFMVADHAHALVRFHRDQARSKMLESEEDEVEPYQRRFAAIIEEGGTPISPRLAGL